MSNDAAALSIEILSAGAYHLKLHSATGSAIGEIKGHGPYKAAMRIPSMGKGVYLLKDSINAVPFCRQLILR